MQNPLLQSSMIHRLQSVASALSVQTWWTAWPPVYATSCLIRLWTDCWARGLWESVIASKILIGWWYFRPIDSWFITSLGKCKMVIKKKSGSILGEMRMFQNISGVNWAADFFFFSSFSQMHIHWTSFSPGTRCLNSNLWLSGISQTSPVSSSKSNEFRSYIFYPKCEVKCYVWLFVTPLV